MDYIELSAKITPLEPARDILIAELAEIDFESFVETDDGLLAYVQQQIFDETKIALVEILKNSNFNITYSTKLVEDQNWNKTWEENFNPINVENKCLIRAPFHEKETNIEYDIIINPKMSFGTGHHETTYLMIKRLLELDVTDKNILDMGCGTGVLAILTKMKKANKVLAIDIDEWAFNNTLENIETNNCADIEVLLGGAEQLTDFKFDIIIANINRNILLNDMSNYTNSLINKGSLLLSGFFSSDKEILLNKATALGLSLTFEESKNDWTLLHLIKE